jgi:hypothetical protein
MGINKVGVIPNASEESHMSELAPLRFTSDSLLRSE